MGSRSIVLRCDGGHFTLNDSLERPLSTEDFDADKSLLYCPSAEMDL